MKVTSTTCHAVATQHQNNILKQLNCRLNYKLNYFTVKVINRKVLQKLTFFNFKTNLNLNFWVISVKLPYCIASRGNPKVECN